jgi:hypothetical protein
MVVVDVMVPESWDDKHPDKHAERYQRHSIRGPPALLLGDSGAPRRLLTASDLCDSQMEGTRGSNRK